MANLIIHPEYERLLKENERLQNDISNLIEEREYLRCHVCKNLTAEYTVKVGSLECKAFEFECAALRIKRKIELVQAKINRREPIDMPCIEIQLEIEYAKYEELLNEKLKEINDALEWQGIDKLSEEDSKKLKSKYRYIVKKLHPDLNPNTTEQEKNLFFKAASAYENGDLKTIELICDLIEEISTAEKLTLGINELKEKVKSLNETKSSVRTSIEKIKSSFPYNQKDFLANEDAVQSRRNELRQLIEQYKEIYGKYERRLNDLLE